MIRCKCGGTTFVKNLASKGDSRSQDELNVQNRTRYCVVCLETLHTTETMTSELNELRRRAYLWERFAAKEAA